MPQYYVLFFSYRSKSKIEVLPHLRLGDLYDYKKDNRNCLSLLIVYSCQAVDISKQAQLLFKQALEFNATGDYASAVSKYIEAYNEDGGVSGLTDEGLLENSLSLFQENLEGESNRS